jgi:hypothetical protein
MADEQIIRLLEEIRELQKEQLAHYKIALQNQQEAMATQKRAVGRSKIALITLFVLLGFTVLSYFVPLLAWSVSWLARR